MRHPTIPPAGSGDARMVANTNRSILAIFADLANQFATLVRTEAQLARAEVWEEIGQIGIGLGLVVGGRWC
jgi:hypothetical protein